MIHFDHIVIKMWWKCWRWKKIIWWDNTFSSQFYHFVITITKQDELNGKLLFCRPLHFYKNVMKMCKCILYLFYGPLHLKIPAPKNQQWRISFGDSDVFSFGIFGLIIYWLIVVIINLRMCKFVTVDELIFTTGKAVYSC